MHKLIILGAIAGIGFGVAKLMKKKSASETKEQNTSDNLAYQQ